MDEVSYSASKIRQLYSSYMYDLFHFVCMTVLSVCIDACVPGACVGQRGALDPLELDLQIFVTHHVVLGLNLGSLKEQMFLATESSL